MDPATIAAAVGALLAPHLKKVAEDFVGEAGQVVEEKAKLLWKKLRDRLRGDQAAEQTLTKFESNPDAGRAAFEAEMEARVAKDAALRDEITGALAEIKRVAPQVRVVQKVKEAEELVGVKARRLSRGSVDVNQDADQTKKVVGVELDEIG